MFSSRKISGHNIFIMWKEKKKCSVIYFLFSCLQIRATYNLHTNKQTRDRWLCTYQNNTAMMSEYNSLNLIRVSKFYQYHFCAAHWGAKILCFATKCPQCNVKLSVNNLKRHVWVIGTIKHEIDFVCTFVLERRMLWQNF